MTHPWLEDTTGATYLAYVLKLDNFTVKLCHKRQNISHDSSDWYVIFGTPRHSFQKTKQTGTLQQMTEFAYKWLVDTHAEQIAELEKQMMELKRDAIEQSMGIQTIRE